MESIESVRSFLQKNKVRPKSEFNSTDWIEKLVKKCIHTNFCLTVQSSLNQLSQEINPLLGSLRKGSNNKWKWIADHELVFNRIKNLFSEEVLLRHPDKKVLFILATGASATSLGASFFQKPEEGTPKLISCASPSLKMPELNYSTTEIQLFAIVLSLHTFRTFLIFSKVLIQTDHKALTFLITCRFLSRRLIRWALCM